MKKLLITLTITIFCLMSFLPVAAIGFDFDTAAKSVFVIVSGDEHQISQGSGFAIDNNLIVTNAHVILNKDQIAIACYSETDENNIGDAYAAELVSIDEDIDIAVLRVNGITLTPLKQADVTTIKNGDDVYAIGAPEGLPYTLTKGTVSSKLREMNGVKYVQTDAAINPGNSGGPLLNDDGEVIGINTLKSASGENMGFAIRIDFAMSYINGNSGASIQNKDKGSGNSGPSSGPKDDGRTYGSGSSNNSSSVVIYVVVSAVTVAVLGFVLKLILSSAANKDKSNADLDVPVIENSFAAQGTDFDSSQETSLIFQQKTTGGLCILSGSMKDAALNMTDGQSVIIGKDPNLANLILDASYSMVSRVHCTVTYVAKVDKYFVTDCSTNGTYYGNGIRFVRNARTPVAKGSIIKLANDNCLIKLI